MNTWLYYISEDKPNITHFTPHNNSTYQFY